MMMISSPFDRMRPFIERADGLSLRERALLFAAGVVLVYIAWQTLLMAPLTARAQVAEQRLAISSRQMVTMNQLGAAAAQDPVVAAALRNRALAERLGTLDVQLNSIAQGYVAPARIPELLRQLVGEQHGLRLLSLDNLPVQSLSQPPGSKQDAPVTAEDRGPYLHPVEIVVEGDYGSVVAYLRALEGMPWRIHWERLELTAGDYPLNRVRIVIGALSLSRDWITV